MFEYEFMRRAYLAGSVLAVILPLIGLPILLKRLSMMGDTLSHASLAGVAIGLCLGFDPLLGSPWSPASWQPWGVELISSRLKAYQEISTVIVLATAIGLAGIFTSLTGGSNAISSYLFGSIVTIGDFELALVLVVAAVVLVTYRLIYDRLYLSAFDPVAAPLMGIDGRALNLAFSFLVAITVSVAAKTIGSLIVSSLMVIPVICAMQFARSYRGTLLLSIALSLAFVHAGLAVSYHQNLRPGSVIVLIAVLALSVAMLAKRRWGYL